MYYSVRGELAGRELVIETGKVAEQANGAVTVAYAETVVLVTACASPNTRDVDFLPLTIDYEERLYAAGKIPGGFFKREGRPSQEAVLAMRLTDRPLRPLFPKGLRNDVQVVITVLSTDRENDPDILAIVGASAALGISDIPFAGPVSAVRVGYLDDAYVLNPTFTQLHESRLDLVVAGTRDAVVMVEAGARELPEDVILGAIKFGQEANLEVIALQDELVRACGRPKGEFVIREADPELGARALAFLQERFAQGLSWRDRAERDALLRQARGELERQLGGGFSGPQLEAALEGSLRTLMRRAILERGLRPSGRGLDEVRPITCEVGSLPRTHGSGLFSRGGTQVLSIATLGSPREEQRIDTISPEESKRFLHHYNFPPFSTGEVRRMGSPGRREIGHGALAERALLPVLPSEEDFPYTIRLVSEVLSSNGSTSMAGVCGSSLSLMDAGVPVKAGVGGVAMGLVLGEDGNFAILTDIEGLEDALGDMDFKVAGTTEGITALQLDIKARGISHQIVGQALAQAREARLLILEKMAQTIGQGRPELSKYAPRLTKIKVDPEKVRFVIGPGGRTIRSIQDECKVTVDVENDGSVIIGSPSEEATQKAIRAIEELTREVEVGGIYTGRVTRVMSFGAFVEILPGKEGMVPLRELSDYPAPSVEDVVKVGDEVMVTVTEIDHLGRINLSRRALFDKQANVPGVGVGTGTREREPERRPPGPRPPRRFGGGGQGFRAGRPSRERAPGGAGGSQPRRPEGPR